MTLQGKHLHVDCASGAAGDMTLGALIDLGVPIDVIGEALDAIGAGCWRLKIERVVKRGIAAVDLKVDTSVKIIEAPARPDRAREPLTLTPTLTLTPSDHGHYAYARIRQTIVEAKLTEDTRVRALAIFDRLARAEAKLHGTTVEQVTFHEVGAIDSIVDVVGTAAALAWLAPQSVSCASVAMGHGTLKSAHGILPVPAPAALEVLREAGGVMADGGLARELCTPTGAAILAATVTSWTAAPPGRVLAVGWGAGDLDFADRPNVLRVVVSEAVATRATDQVWQIEANIDDMTGELCAAAAEAVLAAGALDVWWSPITMKKGRPALVLAALATPELRDAVIAAILRETTTIGVRFAVYERSMLARATVTVATRYGAIAIKVARDGAAVRNAAPEYEACAEAARQHGVPVKLVYAAAVAAYDALP